MKVNYQFHEKRKEKAKETWLRVLSEYNTGKSATEIAKQFTNPQTRKPYTRGYVYWVLKKVAELN